MKLAKTFTKLSATLAIASCFIPASGAQTKPPSKTSTAAAKAATAPPAGPATPAAPVAGAPTGKTPAAGPRRDPFLPLVTEKKDAGNTEHLPSGKAGLVITTVRVDGAVRSPEGMIAVLSNSDQRVYFVREGDQLYDGDVEKIALDGVTFRQNSKDAFGKPVERVVTKRIYASAGEQQ
jgi:hypothetical protein